MQIWEFYEGISTIFGQGQSYKFCC